MATKKKGSPNTAPFAKLTDLDLKQKLISYLSFIVDSMNKGAPGVYLNPEDVAAINQYEPTFLNQPTATNEHNQQLVSVTSHGMAFVQSLASIAAPAAPAPSAPVMPPAPQLPLPTAQAAPAPAGNGQAAPASLQFAISANVPLPPPSQRGGGFGKKEEVYPFSKLAVGHSFFVPSTPEKPDPAKSLSSSVAAATRRFAKVYPEGHKLQGQATGKSGAKFIVRPRNMQEHQEQGARVWRTE